MANDSYFRHVGDWHGRLALPVATPFRFAAWPDDATIAYRLGFLREELEEFQLAIVHRDLPAAADALADLTWVALGTAHYLGIPFEAVWAEVRRANNDKRLRQSGEPGSKRGGIEPVIKPIGWQPPDVQRVLNNHNNDARRFVQGTL